MSTFWLLACAPGAVIWLIILLLPWRPWSTHERLEGDGDSPPPDTRDLTVLIPARNEMCRGEWWVLWRRISGGLTAGQQRALAQPVLAELKGPSGLRLQRRPHELAEIRRGDATGG